MIARSLAQQWTETKQTSLAHRTKMMNAILFIALFAVLGPSCAASSVDGSGSNSSDSIDLPIPALVDPSLRDGLDSNINMKFKTLDSNTNRNYFVRKSLKDIINKILHGYDVNEWPHSFYGKRTDVQVQMFINSFGSLDAANMDFRVDMFLRQKWHDPRLAFSERPYITVMDTDMQKQFWTPDTYFDNVKAANIHTVTVPNIMLQISKYGDVLYSVRYTLILACYMDFNKYPFDVQICTANMSSFASTTDMIVYHWYDTDPIQLPEGLEIAQFDILDTQTNETRFQYSTGNYSGLVAYFTLRRQNGYHMLQTYVPTILIVSISWVSFWLDPNAVPGRVTLGVTTLLTLTTLLTGVRQSLPPVSYVKAIDVWLGFCMIMVFGALIEFTFANWLANKKVSPKYRLKLPECLAGSGAYIGAATDFDDSEGWGTISGGPAQTKAADPSLAPTTRPPPRTYISEARALDRLCRVLYPGIFFLFNVFYWPYYILIQYGQLNLYHIFESN